MTNMPAMQNGNINENEHTESHEGHINAHGIVLVRSIQQSTATQTKHSKKHSQLFKAAHVKFRCTKPVLCKLTTATLKTYFCGQ